MDSWYDGIKWDGFVARNFVCRVECSSRQPGQSDIVCVCFHLLGSCFQFSTEKVVV